MDPVGSSMTHLLRFRFGFVRLGLLLPLLAVLWSPNLLATPLRIVSPMEGSVLRGGSVATIAWSGAAPLPSGAEEWEAFLSLDGGHDYVARITPHLGIDVRSFAWQVPNVSSPSVRLLIRIGNERDESIFELPLRLSIEATPERLSFPMLLGSAADHSESARPGDAPVLQWARGDRSGRGVVLRRAGAASNVRRAVEGAESPTPAAMDWRSDPAAPPRILNRHFRSRSSLHVRALSPQISEDRLLLASRLNI